MGWVAGIFLLLGAQDPVEMQVEAILRQFEAEQEGIFLVEQLMALGGPAAGPLARRLAEDLRDGMASDAAEAILEVLQGRPGVLVPLQTAFADGATTAAGRIELAWALSELADRMTWREGLLAIAADPEAELEARQRAAELLLEAGDDRVLEVFPEVEEPLDAGASPGGGKGKPAGGWREEPRETVRAEGRPAGEREVRGVPLKKKEERVDTTRTAYVIALGAAAAGIAALLLLNRRKG